MERLLHYVWKYKLYASPHFVASSGQPVSVLDPGTSNPHAGPDFFNARVRIGDTVWVGNIELHPYASDWKRHGHHTDPAYDSVVLHVVHVADAEIRRMNGEPIPQITLDLPIYLRENYSALMQSDRPLPCETQVAGFDRLLLVSWLEALLGERLEQKTETVTALLDRYRGDWNEVFYILLTRSFGFGSTGDLFERLACSLPFACIRKHRLQPLQVEALLFGQAAMLEAAGNTDPYYLRLQCEYRFLRHKFGLTPVGSAFSQQRQLRPAGFPHIRLAQLAALWTQQENLFGAVLAAGAPDELRRLFRAVPSGYWETHYHFRYASVRKQKVLGDAALNILLINTVAPVLFAYGMRNHRPEYADKALALLESLPPENNRVVGLFRHAGFPVKHAADTQACLQLKRAYCERKNCLECRIGFKMLQYRK